MYHVDEGKGCISYTTAINKYRTFSFSSNINMERVAKNVVSQLIVHIPEWDMYSVLHEFCQRMKQCCLSIHLSVVM